MDSVCSRNEREEELIYVFVTRVGERPVGIVLTGWRSKA
jgi:hypothetical protein